MQNEAETPGGDATGSPAITIACPRCSGELFHGALQAPDVLATRRGDPDLDWDEDGYFVTCPHCAGRVDIDVRSVEGAGARLRVRR